MKRKKKTGSGKMRASIEMMRRRRRRKLRDLHHWLVVVVVGDYHHFPDGGGGGSHLELRSCFWPCAFWVICVI